ncbi:MAG: hypothetical protein ACXWDE_11140 [Aeromicrobium sp.]
MADSPDLNFDAPLGVLGERVEDLSDAKLPIVPVAPAVGTDHVAYVYAPDDPLAAMVGLVYEDPSWDRIIVYEYVDTQTQASLLEWEEKLVDQGCVAVPEQGDDAVSCRYDPFTQEDIGAGYVAILGTSTEGSDPVLTTIEWIEPLERTKLGSEIGPENNLVIGVQGYAATFSMEEAIDFAKKVVAAPG